MTSLKDASRMKDQNTPFRALIVDDERLARTRLRTLLAAHPEITIAGEADSASTAVAEIDRLAPDLVFLDIQMPGASGFDVLEQTERSFAVVFVTAFDEHALRAFDINAVDYLLKPVTAARLAQSIDRVRRASLSAEAGGGKGAGAGTGPGGTGGGPGAMMFEANGGPAVAAGSGLNAAGAGGAGSEEAVRPDGEAGAGGPGLTYQDHLFVNTGGRARFVKISSIVYISAAGSHSEVVTADGRRALLPKPLREWEARLPTAHFARIHRSTIVNLGFVERMEQSFNYTYEVFLRGIQTPLALSRRYAVRLKRQRA
jgi:two-component system, LytTR family, response regulator